MEVTIEEGSQKASSLKVESIQRPVGDFQETKDFQGVRLDADTGFLLSFSYTEETPVARHKPLQGICAGLGQGYIEVKTPPDKMSCYHELAEDDSKSPEAQDLTEA